MKAVIMAGGRGTRLNPLTHSKPKPMVPLLGRPCMEYIVRLLKENGFKDIGVTLQHMASDVTGYFGDGSGFGVRMSSFVETAPLGTAGSIKAIEGFFDGEPFVVVSGDALTDLDIRGAVEFHKQKKALVTMVSTRVEDPSHYGVIVQGAGGRVGRFQEKPKRSEALGNLVNTGIYVLSPEIFKHIPKGRSVDFGKELFPALVSANAPVYAYDGGGYWSDIGTLPAYRQAQRDMMDGAVRVGIRVGKVRGGPYVARSAVIEDGARIDPCAFVGEGCRVEMGAVIGPGTVLGAGTEVRSGAFVEGSVLWENCVLEPGSVVRGACLGSRVSVGMGVEVTSGSVLGDSCVLGVLAV